ADHPGAVFLRHVPGAVPRTVVRDDDFPVLVVLRLDARQETRQVDRFIERRDDDTYHAAPNPPGTAAPNPPGTEALWTNPFLFCRVTPDSRSARRRTQEV